MLHVASWLNTSLAKARPGVLQVTCIPTVSDMEQITVIGKSEHMDKSDLQVWTYIKVIFSELKSPKTHSPPIKITNMVRSTTAVSEVTNIHKYSVQIFRQATATASNKYSGIFFAKDHSSSIAAASIIVHTRMTLTCLVVHSFQKISATPKQKPSEMHKYRYHLSSFSSLVENKQKCHFTFRLTLLGNILHCHFQNQTDTLVFR